MKHHLLVVDDDESVQVTLRRLFERSGYTATIVGSGEAGLEAFRRDTPDMVLLDLHLPGMSGLEVLDRLREMSRAVPVLMMSGDGTISDAVEAVRMGAIDFVQKPLLPQRVELTVRNALKIQELTERTAELEKSLQDASGILGESRAIKELRTIIERAAPSEGRVLITGANGTGKELVARAIHTGSARSEGPFVTLNCAAVPQELIESELFGHERGAFTGATERKRGRFELAHEGTLFLDEVGEMPLAMQAKVLRALQEGAFERVGGRSTLNVDVRVVAATNRDLEANGAGWRLSRGSLLSPQRTSDRNTSPCRSTG